LGYGIDTAKFPARRWGRTITWRGENKGRLQEALDIWQGKLGISFQATVADAADFALKWDGSAQSWHPGGSRPALGRPEAGKAGTLFLKSDAPLGIVLHEIGHLLGLSHEQDHPDNRDAYYRGQEAWILEGVVTRGALLAVYGPFDPLSVMLYPEATYALMTKPSDGDVASAKAINGWV